jgi:hypothetical protein
MEDEQKTLSLVRDVADVLQDIAASPTHTPALYATFLKALISAKLEPQLRQQPVTIDGSGELDEVKNGPGKILFRPFCWLLSMKISPILVDNSPSILSSPNQVTSSLNGHSNITTNSTTMGGNYYQDTVPYFLNEFQFEGEMGPVQDITTFPPTMVPQTSLDDPTASIIGGTSVVGVGGNGLTMENILSSGFWDSMLVPGEFFRLCFFCFCFGRITLRFF